MLVRCERRGVGALDTLHGRAERGPVVVVAEHEEVASNVGGSGQAASASVHRSASQQLLGTLTAWTVTELIVEHRPGSVNRLSNVFVAAGQRTLVGVQLVGGTGPVTPDGLALTARLRVDLGQAVMVGVGAELGDPVEFSSSAVFAVESTDSREAVSPSSLFVFGQVTRVVGRFTVHGRECVPKILAVGVDIRRQSDYVTVRRDVFGRGHCGASQDRYAAELRLDQRLPV